MSTNYINISSPYGRLNLVGHLLSRFYPTTSVYINESNTPVIVEWIDENEDGIDEFIIYESSVNHLKEYIQGKITHLDLVSRAAGERYHKFYQSLDSANFVAVELTDMGKKNLPAKFSFFKRNESIDVHIVESRFEIPEVEASNEEYFETLKDHSAEHESGLFRLHLRNGTNISHGVADTKIIGEILTNFEDLYNEVARDVFKTLEGHDEGIVTVSDERDFILSSHTEIVLSEAASFSVYLRSKRDFDFADPEAEYRFVGDEIFGKLNDVIQNSSDLNSLAAIKSNFSHAVFGKVKAFAETIFIHQVVLDMEYYNSLSEYESRKTVLPSKAHGIYMSVQNTSFQDSTEIRLSGKFTSINTNTGHFTFKKSGRENDETFSGYFSRLLYENVASFNFRNRYDVVIEQVKIDNVGKQRIRKVNTLVSCILHNQTPA